jgi:galactokinase
VDSEYNTRRAECEEAVRALAMRIPGIRALRDVSVGEFERHGHDLQEIVRKRARHVITENDRVVQSVAALKEGEIARFGHLMNISHNSLRDDSEVSCRELDVMVDLAREVEGVFGSRMTGAGFGGCTVSLVADSAVEDFEKYVGPRYREATGLQPTFYVCRASDGAHRVF